MIYILGNLIKYNIIFCKYCDYISKHSLLDTNLIR